MQTSLSVFCCRLTKGSMSSPCLPSAWWVPWLLPLPPLSEETANLLLKVSQSSLWQNKLWNLWYKLLSFCLFLSPSLRTLLSRFTLGNSWSTHCPHYRKKLHTQSRYVLLVIVVGKCNDWLCVTNVSSKLCTTHTLINTVMDNHLSNKEPYSHRSLVIV